MNAKPPLYIVGWLTIASLLFVGSFVAGRSARTADVRPATPELVRNAVLIDGVRFVTADQVLQASAANEAAKPVIIDVRTSGEFAVAHIAGATNIQDFQLPDAVPSLPADRAWVLYCTCPDDRLAKWGAAAIEHDGFSNAVVLQQGFQAWQQAGGPITTTSDPSVVSQGCGCSVEAEANKLFAINKVQEQTSREPESRLHQRGMSR